MLDHSYAYNPAQGLIVQIEQCGATGTITGYAVQQTSTPGVGRRSYSSGACPYVYGGLTTSVINCGVEVSPIIGIDPTSNEAPAGYSLSQNYPNPFNPVSNIEYSVAKNSFVKISIYDMLGRKVSDLVNRYQTAGSYSVVINASQLTSGVYYYRMEAGDFTDSKRFVVLK